MPNTPLKVTDADFEDFVKKYDTVVVDCWAPWCGPCRMIGPIIEELSKEMHGKVVFGKLNIDENPKTPIKYHVKGIPTLTIFKDGSIQDTKVGALSKSQLIAFIDSTI